MTEFNGLSPGGSSPIAYTPPLGGNDLGMGWYESESFGIYYDSKNGWVYSFNIGWLYIKKLLSGYWCWSQKNDWLWTSADVYPHCYSNITDNWIYFDFSNEDNTQVYNFSILGHLGTIQI